MAASVEPMTDAHPVESPRRVRAGIVGASGYTGAELLRLLAAHPQMNVEAASGATQAGQPIADLYPSLSAAVGDRTYDTYSPELYDGLDVAFIGLPHGLSMDVVPDLLGRVGLVVDMGSDFRLNDAADYPRWYGAEHSCPELLNKAVYGLPELFRSEMPGAELIAATGCNAAAANLTLAPLVAEGLIDLSGITVNLITGVSGAGRPPKANTTFCTVDENVTAYGLLSHRHTPEIEQTLSHVGGGPATVMFTPHLAPMNRGILATCSGRLRRPATTEELLDLMSGFYADSPFVIVNERSPSTKSVQGSNAVHLTARVDDRTNQVLAIGVLDNLVKGAAGMAIQCANIALGLPETTGLSSVGMYP